MKYSIPISVLGHLALVFVFSNMGMISSKSPSPIKPTTIEITLPQPQGKAIILPGRDKEGLPCKSWYGGIGISLSGFLITQVDEGYPAYEAGLLVGDVLQPGEEIRGEPGTQVRLRIRRLHNMLDFTIIRQKICYN